MVTINYYAVLCELRHVINDPLGQQIKVAAFPEICPMNITWLEEKADLFIVKIHKQIKRKTKHKVLLNVYVTGFSPALVALMNSYTRYKSSMFDEQLFDMIVYHYDNRTKAYIPQVIA